MAASVLNHPYDAFATVLPRPVTSHAIAARGARRPQRPTSTLGNVGGCKRPRLSRLHRHIGVLVVVPHAEVEGEALAETPLIGEVRRIHVVPVVRFDRRIARFELAG